MDQGCKSNTKEILSTSNHFLHPSHFQLLTFNQEYIIRTRVTVCLYAFGGMLCIEYCTGYSSELYAVYDIVLYRVTVFVLYNTVLWYCIQYYSMLYCTVQYCIRTKTVFGHSRLYSTVQYCTRIQFSVEIMPPHANSLTVTLL